jgi:hypothetical protein
VQFECSGKALRKHDLVDPLSLDLRHGLTMPAQGAGGRKALGGGGGCDTAVRGIPAQNIVAISFAGSFSPSEYEEPTETISPNGWRPALSTQPFLRP